MLKKIVQIFKTPEIRNRVLVILGLLLLFRLLAAVPLPQIEKVALRSLYNIDSTTPFGLTRLITGASGGPTIALLGVGPYITATIILQLLTMIFPNLKKMYYEEGAIGRAKFNKLSRYITIPLAIVQAYGQTAYLSAQGLIPKMAVTNPMLWLNIITAIAGSMILLWIGELIDEQKLGNGTSLIIFAGIVSAIPSYAGFVIDGLRNGDIRLDTVLIFVAMAAIVISAVVYISQGEHKVPVTYPKRTKGNQVFGGVESYLPVKVNQAGVIPIIFAIAILTFPQLLAQAVKFISSGGALKISEAFQRFASNSLLYGLAYFVLVFVFTYFYTAVSFDVDEVSKNLQRSGGFIPGIRPGEPTAKYLSNIVSKTTLFGAAFLGIIAILPIITQAITGKGFNLGGTALLIAVSVALESANQIDSQLKMREYEDVV